MKRILTVVMGLCLATAVAQAADAEKKKAAEENPKAKWMEKYDKNKDGKLDEAERAALKKDREADYLKKFDKNGDGKLDDEEKAAAKEAMKKRGQERKAK
jgi:hypothetical protein